MFDGFTIIVSSSECDNNNKILQRDYVMRLFPKVALLSAATISSFTYSAGFQVNEHSVSGLGRAYAGEAAMIDNAAVMARNPALMSYFKNKSLSVVTHVVVPNVNVKGTNTASGVAVSPTANLGATVQTEFDASENNIAPTAVVPGLFYIAPINDKLAIGLSLTTYFGVGTKFSDGYGGSEYAGESGITSTYITPSLSYKFTDNFSAGFSVSYIMGTGRLQNSSSAAFSTATGCNLPTGASNKCIRQGNSLLTLKADGDGFTWSAGFVWDVTKDGRLGFRYSPAVDLETDAKYTLISLGPNERKGTLTLNLPAVTELSYVHKLSDSWLVSGDVMLTEWSSFESLNVDDNISGRNIILKKENLEDSFRYAIGADYIINDDTTFRFGYALDEGAVSDENRTMSIPDSDRQWFSLGGTFNVGAGNIDIGYAYVLGKKVAVQEEFNNVTVFKGELTKVSAHIVSIGYNMAF